jgi:hypothetical protein
LAGTAISSGSLAARQHRHRAIADADPAFREVRALAALAPSVLLAAWPWQTTVVAQTPTTTVSGPVIELRGSGAVVLVVALGVVFALLWSVPMWVDARRAYRLRERAVQLVGGRLLDAAKKDNLTIAELRALLGTIGEPATGQRGLARSLMAFTIITVVGVALLALLLSSSTDAGDLRKTVITALLTLLGTIVGFYFGTRAAETGAELAASVPTPPAPVPTPPAPVPTLPAPVPTPLAPVAEEEEEEEEEEATPVGEEEATPTAREEATPVAEAPVAEEEAAPVAEEEAAPVPEEEAAPVAEEETPGPAVTSRRRKSP